MCECHGLSWLQLQAADDCKEHCSTIEKCLGPGNQPSTTAAKRMRKCLFAAHLLRTLLVTYENDLDTNAVSKTVLIHKNTKRYKMILTCCAQDLSKTETAQPPVRFTPRSTMGFWFTISAARTLRSSCVAGPLDPGDMIRDT